MKKALVLSLGILFCAGLAFGQAGWIGLFEDASYVDCDLNDTAPSLKHVYVVHKATPGATASQWMLVNNGMLCTYLAESSPFITIGSAFSGISVAYGSCMPSDILLLDISYFCQGLTPTCATIEIVPDPATPTGTIEVVDCSLKKLEGDSQPMTVNSDGSCDCGQTTCKRCEIPTEDSTWGQIKALYR